MVLASMVGTLAGCASMGGGMRYVESPSLQESTAQL